MRNNMQLWQGDCLGLLKSMPDKSVDLVITDPPYDVHAGKGGVPLVIARHIQTLSLCLMVFQKTYWTNFVE